MNVMDSSIWYAVLYHGKRLYHAKIKKHNQTIWMIMIFLICFSMYNLQNYNQITKLSKKKKVPRLHLYELCPNAIVNLRIDNKYPLQDSPGDIEDNLVFIQKGNIPLVLSVPHGATTKDGTFKWQKKNLPARTSEGADADMSTFESRLSRVNSDTNTHQLAMLISDAVEAQMNGKKPYIVSARFHRRYIDVNRRRNHTEICCPNINTKCTAIAQKSAKNYRNAVKVYDQYFSSVESALRDIVHHNQFHDILLIDVHAQKATEDPRVPVEAEEFLDTIIVGTQDGRLVKNRAHLYKNFLGKLASKLRKSSMNIYPPNSNTVDHPKYNGGHIVASFGFNSTIGARVDALQMEFGQNIRMKLKSRGQQVAKAIATSFLGSEYMH